MMIKVTPAAKIITHRGRQVLYRVVPDRDGVHEHLIISCNVEGYGCVQTGVKSTPRLPNAYKHFLAPATRSHAKQFLATVDSIMKIHESGVERVKFELKSINACDAHIKQITDNMLSQVLRMVGFMYTPMAAPTPLPAPAPIHAPPVAPPPGPPPASGDEPKKPTLH